MSLKWFNVNHTPLNVNNLTHPYYLTRLKQTLISCVVNYNTATEENNTAENISLDIIPSKFDQNHYQFWLSNSVNGLFVWRVLWVYHVFRILLRIENLIIKCC